MMKKPLVLICLLIIRVVFCQTPVTFSTPPNNSQISSYLSGPNITVSNGKIIFGKPSQIATFTNGLSANLEMEKGVYFSTGSAADDLSRRNSYIATGNSPADGITYSDYDLKTVDKNAVHDVLSYEFTITLANTVSGVNIAYQFGSEEYPDYIGSTYNDAFGFFISGPGIVGKQNLAKLPNGKDTNVNTINPGVRGNSAAAYPDPSFDPSQAGNYINNGHTTATYVRNGTRYYYMNQEPQNGPKPVYVEHNGLSRIINYSIRNLVPGETYTFKIIIGDSSDDQRDSGVFIKNISAFADLNATEDYFEYEQNDHITSSVFANDSSNNKTVDKDLVSITSRDLPAGFSLNVDGTINISKSVSEGTYRFNYTICDKSNPIYCKTAPVTVIIKAPPCCYLPASKGGHVLPAHHGITALGRAGKTNDNWPMIRKGAHTVLEAKTKGFVINRLTTDQKNLLIPALGMAVYDISLDCLSIYDGIQWKCYNKQTCP